MRKFAVVLALVLLPLATARAQSCPGVAPWVFVDVAASHAFCTYVTWMAQNNITLGCRIIDANNRDYCPDDSVSRLQMAAFMNRLGNALFPLSCAAGQVMKWNGAAWTCSDDNIGGSGGGGTVTSVLAGTGLAASPNPIVGAGVLNLALGYQLPQACANGQVPKSNGAGGWTCQNDNDTNSGGTVTSLTQGAGITLTPNPIAAAGTISADTTYLQRRVSSSCAVGSSIREIAANGGVTCETDDAGPANAFVQGGNAYGATAVLGTTDNQALDIRLNNSRVMRYEPNALSPNLIGGNLANNVTAGVRGATIAGGGVPIGDTDPDFDSEGPNRVTDHYGTVGGGYANVAGDATAPAGSHAFATVGGGINNVASGAASTVGGGIDNDATGPTATVGGGVGNTASGPYSMVSGGFHNTASGASSFAAGSLARTQTADDPPTIHHGAFVWADHNIVHAFHSAANNEFAARATGGVRFVTAVDFVGLPTRTVSIDSDGRLSFGAVTRQMLNLWDTTWGIGVQPSTMYFRSGNHFGWYLNGTHADAPLDPGVGGAMLMTLTNGASASAVTGTLRAQVVTATSDRAQKLDFAAVDGQDVLARVVALPIETWAYRNEPAVRHMGPTGQAFQAAFGLGHDDKSIATVDADGIALAAIQGLNAKLEAQAQEIATLKRLVEHLLAAR